eukprot:scaffold203139_cov18-Tisochrysis_lutea.AAC.1
MSKQTSLPLDHVFYTGRPEFWVKGGDGLHWRMLPVVYLAQASGSRCEQCTGILSALPEEAKNYVTSALAVALKR